MGRTIRPIAKAKLETTSDFIKDEKIESKKGFAKPQLFEAKSKLNPNPSVKIALRMKIDPKKPIIKFQRGIGRTSRTKSVLRSISR